MLLIIELNHLGMLFSQHFIMGILGIKGVDYVVVGQQHFKEDR